MTTRPLTDRQKEILGQYVKMRRLRYPTVREVAQHFGMHPSTVQQHLSALRRKGFLPPLKKTT